MQFALTLQLAFCTGEQCAYFDAWMHVAFNWTTWILQQKSVVRSTHRRNHANTPLVETGCRCTTSFLHCFIIRNEHIKGCFSISQYCVYKCFINMQLGHSYNFLNCVYSGSRSSLRGSFQLVFFCQIITYINLLISRDILIWNASKQCWRNNKQTQALCQFCIFCGFKFQPDEPKEMIFFNFDTLFPAL